MSNHDSQRDHYSRLAIAAILDQWLESMADLPAFHPVEVPIRVFLDQSLREDPIGTLEALPRLILTGLSALAVTGVISNETRDDCVIALTRSLAPDFVGEAEQIMAEAAARNAPHSVIVESPHCRVCGRPGWECDGSSCQPVPGTANPRMGVFDDPWGSV